MYVIIEDINIRDVEKQLSRKLKNNYILTIKKYYLNSLRLLY